MYNQKPMKGLAENMIPESVGQVQLTYQDENRYLSSLILNNVQYMSYSGINFIPQGKMNCEWIHDLQIVNEKICI